MNTLKDYMLIFRADLDPNFSPTQQQQVEMKNAWSGWIGGIAQNARLVSSHQLGFESSLISKEESKSEKSSSVTGNLVLKAQNFNEAIELSRGCPILQMGGTVEVRNTLNVYS
ncbi:MAG: hypothetical protein HRT74_10355 [Flavobacteriales bacterium]|nr:hypothetical protein [Flavobacteriales bacterium]